MRVLHFNSNFLYTRIYENLLDNIDEEIEHIIYVPQKRSNKKVVESKYKVLQPEIISSFDSYLTFHRRNKSYKYIKKEVNLHNDMLIHAHTLTNDGVLAYYMYKKYGFNYILTIRNTDINFTLKYKKHLKSHFEKVLLNAELLIFPNYSYKKRMKSIFKKNSNIIEKIEKAIVVQNGIEDIWLQNIKKNKKSISNKLKINMLFIGRVYPQKNIHRVLKAIENMNVNYKIIGKVIDEGYFNRLKADYQFEYLGEKNKKEIIEIMEDCDIFIMPSENETFGLVYIESLTQNLPIIYSENEGIDGYFEKNKYGVSVDPKNIKDIQKGIELLLDNYDDIQENLVEKSFLEEFDWGYIGGKYSDLYKGLKR